VIPEKQNFYAEKEMRAYKSYCRRKLIKLLLADMRKVLGMYRVSFCHGEENNQLTTRVVANNKR
jgi:hypothetical protein